MGTPSLCMLVGCSKYPTIRFFELSTFFRYGEVDAVKALVEEGSANIAIQ